MSAQKLPLCLTQGETFNKTLIYLANRDVTSYTPTGEIRDNFLEESGNLLATFSFLPIVFTDVEINGVTTQASVIRPVLTATETSLLPYSEYLNGKLIIGVNALIYDIKLTNLLGEVIILARGTVEVLPRVTQ